MTTDDVLRELTEGNLRFAAGHPVRRDPVAERHATAGAHRPCAVVLSCSDARVPAETVFDQPVGSLFVVRAAGHAPGPAGMASIRFAVEMLGARVVVVLGHEDCGAVRAAVAGDAPEWLAPVLALVDTGGSADPDVAIEANARHGARTVERHLRDAGLDETVVVAGVYRLASGEVAWLS